ncbi:uncharacterized protein LOC126977403 [Leptidea sinapis]|uniref:uncharacterized protein LOC126977403 n=1 Tax=Leptidea sinapis TaxID=189913 RepID=UPI00213E9249|nr:uncharacterized protein LOC126977403 [Leptidea sinapis]
MALTTEDSGKICYDKYVTEIDVQYIVKKYFNDSNYAMLDHYSVKTASTKMLGFLSDYLKITVYTKNSKTEAKETIQCFLKCISKVNKAKAAMVRDLNLLSKEVIFYSDVKNKLYSPAIKPWSPRFITSIKDAIVLENLNARGYKVRDKLVAFEENHTLQALKTLAAFHAASIIFEERNSKKLKNTYRLNDEFDILSTVGAYEKCDPWFVQCMDGALQAIKNHSKYYKNEKCIKSIEEKWQTVWESALHLSNYSTKHRNVICHRDLWNNNILFHYADDDGRDVPDDCLLVDFQAFKSQPPAGDVMCFIYCNLDQNYRNENLSKFLNYYYSELQNNLTSHGLSADLLSINEFLESCEEQRLWGLIVSACLLPLTWIDDQITTTVFTDTVHFDNILFKDRASFILKMMESNNIYKQKVLTIFEEIIETYCLN